MKFATPRILFGLASAFAIPGPDSLAAAQLSTAQQNTQPTDAMMGNFDGTLELSTPTAFKASKSKKRDSKGGKGDCSLDAPQKSMDNDMVNCADLFSSLNNLVSYLTDDNVPDSSANIVDPTSPEYDAARKQYASAAFATSPSFIVQPDTKVEVQAAVLFAAECEYKVTVRSGGHSFNGISSCDGEENPCLQLDMSQLNQVDVVTLSGNQGKQLRVGSGTLLNDLASAYVTEGIFIPGGECSAIGVGGHMQTGGFGEYSRILGAFSSYVDSFQIVLSDGSLRTVVRPAKTTSDFNDDIFYAVLGGAAGSWGVVLEATLNTINVEEHYSVYWEVNFLYDDDTLPGIKNMLGTYADVAMANENDTRWGVFWSFVGSKFLLNQAFGGNGGFNYLQFDLAWVVPRKGRSFSEEDALGEAQAFYNSIVDECTGCIYLEDIVPTPLLPRYGSVRASTRPLSEQYKDILIFDWSELRLEENNVPYTSSWQQGPKFLDAEAMKSYVDLLDAQMPKIGNEPRFVISQFATIGSPKFANDDISLPFQEDVIGVLFDIWDFVGAQTGQTNSPFYDGYVKAQRELQDHIISEGFSGVDHRMFWGAYEEPNLEDGDWMMYYDDERKYKRLQKFKTCVDPHNVFENRMSIPVSGV